MTMHAARRAARASARLQDVSRWIFEHEALAGDARALQQHRWLASTSETKRT